MLTASVALNLPNSGPATRMMTGGRQNMHAACAMCRAAHGDTEPGSSKPAPLLTILAPCAVKSVGPQVHTETEHPQYPSQGRCRVLRTHRQPLQTATTPCQIRTLGTSRAFLGNFDFLVLVHTELFTVCDIQ